MPPLETVVEVEENVLETQLKRTLELKGKWIGGKVEDDDDDDGGGEEGGEESGDLEEQTEMEREIEEIAPSDRHGSVSNDLTLSLWWTGEVAQMPGTTHLRCRS